LLRSTVTFIFIDDETTPDVILPHLGVSVRANKSLKSIELFLDEQLSPATWERIDEQGLQATFNPSL